jgi:predicted peptidase
MKLFTLLLCLLALTFISTAVAADAPKPMQVEIRELPEAISKTTTSLNAKFIVATPANAVATEPLPLLIFLHGAGQRGADIEKLREQQPLKYFNTQSTQPFIIVMPQCLSDKDGVKHIWEVADLEALFAHLTKTLRFDKQRGYLIGYSMGGYGTWAWASAHPEHFAAIAPHAGGLGHGGPKDVTPDLDQWVKKLVPLPIRIVHGAKDNVVPPERSERMFRMLKASGAAQVELRILPGKDHGIGSALADEELYAWLLKHSRKDEKGTKP